MTVTNWRWLVFDEKSTDGSVLKSHLVPSSLERALLADLAARGSNTAHRSKRIKEMHMDAPGMFVVGRPYEIFKFSGLSFHVPSEDCVEFADRMNRMQERTFAPLPGRRYVRRYYKLHSWMHCLVLLPHQFIRLRTLINSRLVEAEQRAKEFYLQRSPPSVALREAAALVDGRELAEIPHLGGAKQDRFYPQKRGEA